MGGRGNPYVTVVAVWIVSAFELAMVVSFPISSVILFSGLLLLILAVAGYSVYKRRHKDLGNQSLVENLLASFRGFVIRVSGDLGVVSTRVSARWLQREARIREEMAQEHERQTHRRERLAQLERNRSTRPANEPPPTAKEYEYAQRIQRRLQEKRAEG